MGSAENAADVQDDYLDGINCDGYDPSNDVMRELCRDLEEVRSSQVSAAVSPIAITVATLVLFFCASVATASYVHEIKRAAKSVVGLLNKN